MALILRACTAVPTRRCFKELTLFARSISCVKYNDGDVKSRVANFQIKRFSSSTTGEGGDEKKLVYVGQLHKQIRAIKLFSIASSVTMLICQPMLMAKIMESDNAVFLGSSLLISTFFILISPMLLHIITKKYVIRIYHYPGSNVYSAVTYNLFALEKRMKFNSRQVILPVVEGPFTSCYVRGVPMFFAQESFLEPEHYIKLMNFDKPIDLKMQDASKQCEEITEENEENLERRRSENKG